MSLVRCHLSGGCWGELVPSAPSAFAGTRHTIRCGGCLSVSPGGMRPFWRLTPCALSLRSYQTFSEGTD